MRCNSRDSLAKREALSALAFTISRHYGVDDKVRLSSGSYRRCRKKFFKLTPRW